MRIFTPAERAIRISFENEAVTIGTIVDANSGEGFDEWNTSAVVEELAPIADGATTARLLGCTGVYWDIERIPTEADVIQALQAATGKSDSAAIFELVAAFAVSYAAADDERTSFRKSTADALLLLAQDLINAAAAFQPETET